MPDPFQDVDAAGEEFVASFAEAMDVRQSDPTMEKIVSSYLSQLAFNEDSLTIEVGSGAGAVSRRIASFANPSKVIGFEPSTGFVAEARNRAEGLENLEFKVADGAALPLPDKSVDNVIMHTVLTHVTRPESLIAEAKRVLKSGGQLVVCDADFSKATLGRGPGDPLEACAKAFVEGFVTDPFFVAKVRKLIAAEGLQLDHFEVQSRTVLDNDQMLPWVQATCQKMFDQGEIGQALFDGLIAEYRRRADAKQLYGYQVFATAISRKP
ncbi:class I SAM-dependent methyltransferase [Falsihalocynthiibacter sp. SS001]|uniref:class I SAM-dependent methyltransferase n=1 Tax=Falsihalocynthiibacter sp. SS001 TaxID=3349698 RepID=UPI0036D292E7